MRPSLFLEQHPTWKEPEMQQTTSSPPGTPRRQRLRGGSVVLLGAISLALVVGSSAMASGVTEADISPRVAQASGKFSPVLTFESAKVGPNALTTCDSIGPYGNECFEAGDIPSAVDIFPNSSARVAVVGKGLLQSKSKAVMTTSEKDVLSIFTGGCGDGEPVCGPNWVRFDLWGLSSTPGANCSVRVLFAPSGGILESLVPCGGGPELLGEEPFEFTVMSPESLPNSTVS